ncbi:hypothetical protein Tco_0988526 [Tanacetum coccineum]|uniref:Uncharacterized protein n=1 Tax=Tanacetum coccineum TaxID=301880 RepID=A0ABQ5ESI7_9ASTR
MFVKHAVAIASAQKNKGSLEAESIVRAASIRVQFPLSTTPFFLGVRGVEVGAQFPSSLKNLEVSCLRTLSLSVRQKLMRLEISFESL